MTVKIILLTIIITVVLGLFTVISCGRAVQPSTQNDEERTSSVGGTPVPTSTKARKVTLYREITAGDLEANLRNASPIVRGRMLGVEELVQTPSDRTDGVYRSYMAFRIQVLEYLRGSGSDTIWAVVYLPGAKGSNAQSTNKVYRHYLKHRDTSWDNLEAIVLLGKAVSSSDPIWGITTQPDYYGLGYFSKKYSDPYDDNDAFIDNPIETYSPNAYGGWLPIAPSGGSNGTKGTRDTGGEQEVLYSKPPHVRVNIDNGSMRATRNAESGSLDTWTLADVRELSSQPPEEIARRIMATSVVMAESYSQDFRAEIHTHSTKVAATAYAVLTATAVAQPTPVPSTIPVATALPTVVPVPPSAPQNLTATTTYENITLSWDVPAGDHSILGYRIFRRTPPAEVEPNILVDNTGTTATTYTDTSGVTYGSRFIYRVQAITAAGAGEASLPVRAIVDELPPPQNLTAVATHDSVSISWDAPAGNHSILGYRIVRRPQRDAEFTQVADTDLVTTYTDTTGIESAAKYIYLVRALIAQGIAADARVAVTTANAPEPEPTAAPTTVPSPVASVEVPQPPQNLIGTWNEDGTITLLWDASSDDSVTGYQILRRRPTQGEDTLTVYVENTGNTAAAYTDTEVTPGIQHVYRVKAINAAGLSEQSNFVRVDP